MRLRHLLAMLGDWFGRGEGLMAAPRCDLTDLLVTDCAHCRGVKSVDEETKAERARLLATGRWVVAQYAGTCAHCGEHFGPGAAIRMFPGGWRADCCGEAGP